MGEATSALQIGPDAVSRRSLKRLGDIALLRSSKTARALIREGTRKRGGGWEISTAKKDLSTFLPPPPIPEVNQIIKGKNRRDDF